MAEFTAARAAYEREKEAAREKAARELAEECAGRAALLPKPQVSRIPAFEDLDAPFPDDPFGFAALEGDPDLTRSTRPAASPDAEEDDPDD